MREEDLVDNWCTEIGLENEARALALEAAIASGL